MSGTTPRCELSYESRYAGFGWAQANSRVDEALVTYKSLGKYDAVVVGSGPNGLAAAITMAARKLSVLVLEGSETIGGGLRTRELTLPGFKHDVCAAVHPLALASPFMRSLNLHEYGLEWIHPPYPLAHPLVNDRAVLLNRSLNATAEALGIDSEAYKQIFHYYVSNWEGLISELLKPLGPPSRPVLMVRFGLKAMRSAKNAADAWFRGKRARALFAGNAAHSILPLETSFTASFGMMLSIIGHALGWPFAKGGSNSFADALLTKFLALGGDLRTSCPVSALEELPQAGAVLLDLSPNNVAKLGKSIFPLKYCANLTRHAWGPGVFKMDWALEAPIPWSDPECSKAGTLHIGGELEDICYSERAAWSNRPSEKPFVLLTQPTLFDRTRAPAGKHIAWAYCHVPNGCTVDMSEVIENRIETFAPGFRDTILARHKMFPIDMENYNPNYVGGDIAGGAQNFANVFIRPSGRFTAYSTPVKGYYICSASMPPGAGVHGMCGHLAAQLAINEVFSS